MSVTLAINPITWTNDDMPELGGDIPLDVCLAEARLAGYAGIELGGKFPRRAEELRPILARHRLELASGWYSAQLCRRTASEELAAMADHLELLAAMGCKAMVFAEGHGSTDGNPAAPLSTRPVLAEPAWPGFCERLNDVARHLRVILERDRAAAMLEEALVGGGGFHHAAARRKIAGEHRGRAFRIKRRIERMNDIG